MASSPSAVRPGPYFSANGSGVGEGVGEIVRSVKVEQQAAPGYSVVDYTGSQFYKSWDGGTTVNGVFFLCEDSANSAVAMSTDNGVTWSQRTPTGTGGAAMFRSMVAVNSTIVLTDYGQTNIYRSMDSMLSVTTVSMTPYGMTNTGLLVRSSGASFLVINASVNAAYSADGITWSAVTLPVAPVGSTPTTTIAGKFVITVSNGVMIGDADGTGFTFYATPLVPRSVAFGNGIWLVWDVLGYITVTTDFVSFKTTATAVAGTTSQNIAYSTVLKVFVMSAAGAMYYSADGISWLRVDTWPYRVQNSSGNSYRFSDDSILSGVTSINNAHRFHSITSKVTKTE